MMKRLFPILLFVLLGLSLRAQEVRYLTTQEFKDQVFDYTKDSVWQYKGTTPCVIDFYTTWCGPCKRLAPVMEELAKEYEGKVIFYKVDTERERELAYYFQITSIPQILFVPVGDRPQLAKGALPKETLVEAITEVLLKKKKK